VLWKILVRCLEFKGEVGSLQGHDIRAAILVAHRQSISSRRGTLSQDETSRIAAVAGISAGNALYGISGCGFVLRRLEVSVDGERERTELITDAIRGWVSAPGMKREMVLCATERPAKESAMIVERIVMCCRADEKWWK